MSYYSDDTVTLLHGDALEQGRTLEAGSVQSIVTSPPYFGLRDYGMVGQLGAETSVHEYVANMVALFAELRRVLADDGTLWLNLGDSYSSAGGKTGVGVKARVGNTLKQRDSRTRPASDAPAKNLLGIPWRVAFGLQADGWILRSDIIWHKPNPMPESVTDRPTKSHEYMFLLSKSPKYFYNAAAIAEPVTDSTVARLSQDVSGQRGSSRANGGGKSNGTMKAVGAGSWRDREYDQSMLPEGMQQSGKKGRPRGSVDTGGDTRNARTVWSIPTVPFGEAHFAVYPPELIRPCILAGSRPGDTILDPFSGSGTTGMVATQEGRKYVGIDLNSDYLDLSLRTRFQQPSLNFGGVA
jgi:site-specific DNA-methyltransferase (cytosine-N4-specific)